jgi:hypothetical protein
MSVATLPTTIGAQIVEITPQLAQEYLRTQKLNRKLSSRMVMKYARDMAADDWQFTGEPIIFDAEGRLVDGQHRLSAICQADVTVPLFVVRGVDPKAFHNMDTGKTRSLRDVLQIYGYMYPDRLSAALAVVAVYRQYGDMRRLNHHDKPSREALLALLSNEPELVDTNVLMGRLSGNGAVTRGFFVGPTIACLHVLMGVDEDDALEFAGLFAKGAHLGEDNPIYQLRIRFNNWEGQFNEGNQNERCALVFKAWNLWRKGETAGYLRWVGGGSKPEAFPKPV